MLALTALFCSLALAASAPADPVAGEQVPTQWTGETLAPPQDLDAPLDLEAVWAAMEPDALLREAITRRSVGDFEGADARFAALRERVETAEIVYQAAMSLEFQERYADALGDYDAVIARWPDDPVADDARLRRAFVLDDLGRHAQSLDQIRELQRAGDWNAQDRLTLDLERGVSELQAGKARKGIRTIQAALDELQGTTDLSWMQGKARIALARYQLDQAQAVQLTGNKKAVRRLKQRVHLLSQAERQVVAITQLGEPEHILVGLQMLGDAYLDLHDALLAAPPPRRLDAEQRELYTEMVEKQVATLQSKAWAYYDEGVKLGVRVQWQGKTLDTLRARRDALSPAQ